MPNPTRTWQLISLALAAALIVVLVELNRSRDASRHSKSTLPTVYKMTGYEHLALSPNARRALERYSL